MLKFWTFFIKKHQFTMVLAGTLVVLGLFSLNQIPKESSPNVNIPVISILTTIPGANSIEMEKLVTNILEKPIRNNVSHIKQITSKSQQNISIIIVEFYDGTDLQKAVDNVRAEVDNASGDLPSDTNDSRIIQYDLSDKPIFSFIVSTNAPPAIMNNIAEETVKDIEKIHGVSTVSAAGLHEQTISIIVSESALSEYRLTMSDISQAIKKQNTTIPMGTVTVNDTEYAIQFKNDISDKRTLLETPIRTRSGATITIADIATVKDSFSDPVKLIHTFTADESKTAFILNVYKRKGAKITAVGNAVKERIKVLQEDGNILHGLTVINGSDSALLLEESLSSLLKSGITTVLLVVLVLFIAVGTREALIAGLSIPLSFLTAFIALKWSGNTINFISLFALILSTGIIVDSAIVVVEGINNNIYEKHSSKRNGAKDAIAEYSIPLTSGLLTTIAVFAPLLTLPGIVGQFIFSIPFTIISVLISSLFISLAVTPVFGIFILKRTHKQTRLEIHRTNILTTIKNKYKELLYDFLHNKKNISAFITVLALFFVLTLSFPIMGIINTSFFPADDSDYGYIDIKLSEGSTMKKTNQALEKISQNISNINGIVSYYSITGQSTSLANKYNSGGLAHNLGNIFLTFEKGTDTDRTIATIKEKLATIKDIDISIGKPKGGPPSGAPIEITFFGDNMAELDNITNEAINILKHLPKVTDIRSTSENTLPQITVIPNRLLTTNYGIPTQIIGFNIAQTIGENSITTIRWKEKTYPVMMELDSMTAKVTTDDGESQIDALKSTPVYTLQTQNGQNQIQLPLETLAEINITQNRNTILHEDARRITTLNADSDNVNKTMIVFRKKIKQILNNHPDIDMSIGGESKDTNQSFADMFIALFLGIVGMFAVLIVQFNSIRHTLYILLTVPLALIGVFIGLLLMNEPLSFPSLMGFVALSGIVVNNAIILIDVINNKIRVARKNKSYDDNDFLNIIVNSATSRLRPVLLTTITTVVGTIPLIFTAAIWAPLAYSIIFGLTFATILTLVVIPAIYYRWPGKI